MKKIFNMIMKSRQAPANHLIARQLHQEFRNESFEYVLNMVNEGSIVDRLSEIKRT